MADVRDEHTEAGEGQPVESRQQQSGANPEPPIEARDEEPVDAEQAEPVVPRYEQFEVGGEPPVGARHHEHLEVDYDPPLEARYDQPEAGHELPGQAGIEESVESRLDESVVSGFERFEVGGEEPPVDGGFAEPLEVGYEESPVAGYDQPDAGHELPRQARIEESSEPCLEEPGASGYGRFEVGGEESPVDGRYGEYLEVGDEGSPGAGYDREANEELSGPARYEELVESRLASTGVGDEQRVDGRYGEHLEVGDEGSPGAGFDQRGAGEELSGPARYEELVESRLESTGVGDEQRVDGRYAERLEVGDEGSPVVGYDREADEELPVDDRSERARSGEALGGYELPVDDRHEKPDEMPYDRRDDEPVVREPEDSHGAGGLVEIDGYRDITPIGRGGLGDVYRATRDSTGLTVAIKVLRDVADESAAWRRTQRELQALVSLNGHDNVIGVLEVVETSSGRALVMEYAPGGSIAEVLVARGTTLSVSETIFVGRQVAGAIEAAHAAGIVHRDIKPQNLLIGQYGQIKLCDFGIASLLRSTEFRERTSAISMRYASPEDLEDDDEVGPLSDVYSLGATLLHLVRGAPPTLRERLTRWSPPAGVTDPELAALDSILELCLAAEPELRPNATDVHQMFVDLERRIERPVKALESADLPWDVSVIHSPGVGSAQSGAEPDRAVRPALSDGRDPDVVPMLGSPVRPSELDLAPWGVANGDESETIQRPSISTSAARAEIAKQNPFEPVQDSPRQRAAKPAGRGAGARRAKRGRSRMVRRLLVAVGVMAGVSAGWWLTQRITTGTPAPNTAAPNSAAPTSVVPAPTSVVPTSIPPAPNTTVPAPDPTPVPSTVPSSAPVPATNPLPPPTAPPTVPNPPIRVEPRPNGLPPIEQMVWPVGPVGECLVEYQGTVGLTAVDCQFPHDVQRIGVGTLPVEVTGVYDPARIEEAARVACASTFLQMVFDGDDVAGANSQFDTPITWPSEGSFAAGDRIYQCWVGVGGQRVVGNAIGSHW